MTAEQHPVKARLYKIKEIAAGSAEKPPTVKILGTPVTVQFNPTSLKLERRNDTSGGAQTKAQRRNRPNEGHATLSVELEFDTAEGGPDGNPLDVRKKTQAVRQFAEPPEDDPSKAPPRIRFEWGAFGFDGIVEHLGEEIDYFSGDGLPLRAKISLTITGQDLRFERNTSGPGARKNKGATPPGGGQEDTGPNAPPAKNPDRTVAAQDGESVQQLLSRLDADPATWRSAMAGLTSPLDLAAGTQVQLGASVAVDAGIGVAAGFSGGAGIGDVTSADASTGASADGTVGFAAEASVGFALSAGGGVAAAVGRTLSRAADQAVANARGSFDVPGSAADGPTMGGGVSPGVPGGAVIARSQGGAPPEVDRRAVSYGYGVPLRPRIVPLASPASAAPSAAAETAQRDRDARPSTLRWSPCSTGCCQR
jgi:Contractile injection system tube protein